MGVLLIKRSILFVVWEVVYFFTKVILNKGNSNSRIQNFFKIFD